MLPALILDPKPSDIVVDMCAAPGSKATHLAQIMGNEGVLYLIDRNRNRIPSLRVNIDRTGVINSIILNFDSRNITNLEFKADKILLDAPCTGEGLIRQDPDRKKSKKLKDIHKMSKIQGDLLKAGLSSLKSGGTLLYSTCSIAPEENEMVIDKILRDKPEFRIVKIPYDFGVNGITEFNGFSFLEDLKNAQRLYPHLHDTIGFFLCLIRKIR
jgi:NOL1/NOP2/sun family putative RNA methylase